MNQYIVVTFDRESAIQSAVTLVSAIDAKSAIITVATDIDDGDIADFKADLERCMTIENNEAGVDFEETSYFATKLYLIPQI